jgi:DNA-binding phage protein
MKTLSLKVSQIVPLPRAVKAVSIPLNKLDSFEGRRMIARLLRTWEKEAKTNTFKSLADRVGLHRRTVQKIASEVTMWPRLHTILAIMGGIGFTAVRFE